MTKHLGVDVSHWQGENGLPIAQRDRLVEGGVEFAIFKISESTGFVDPAADENIRRARAVGLLVGVYHFLTGGMGRAQARHFLQTAKRLNGGTLANLLLVVDVEAAPWARNPRARDVRRFVSVVNKAAPKNSLVIYTGEGYWRAIGNPDMAPHVDGLWQARWDGARHTLEDPNLPAFPPRAGFGGWGGRPPLWQYGQLHYVADGQGHAIDGNVFYGSDAELRDLFTTRKPRPDVSERPKYVAGYNAMVGEADAELPYLADPPYALDPDAPPHPVWTSGVDEAREDIAAAVKALRIKTRKGKK